MRRGDGGWRRGNGCGRGNRLRKGEQPGTHCSEMQWVKHIMRWWGMATEVVLLARCSSKASTVGRNAVASGSLFPTGAAFPPWRKPPCSSPPAEADKKVCEAGRDPAAPANFALDLPHPLGFYGPAEAGKENWRCCGRRDEKIKNGR